MKWDVEAGYSKDRWTTTEQFEQFLEQYGKLIVQEVLFKARGAKIRNESMDKLIEQISTDFGVK